MTSSSVRETTGFDIQTKDIPTPPPPEGLTAALAYTTNITRLCEYTLSKGLKLIY